MFTNNDNSDNNDILFFSLPIIRVYNSVIIILLMLSSILNSAKF